MSTPGPAPNVSLVHEPSAPDVLNPQAVPDSKRAVPRAYVILAALGWLAAGFSFWLQSIGHEPSPTPPAVLVEDREKAESQVEATQQKLATARSALAVTTRLRDEAAQALQDVRERTAGTNQTLAAARSELDDIRQKIAAQSSELAMLTTRLDTARLRDSKGKKQADASAHKAPTNPVTAAPPPLSASAAVNKDLAAARSELDDIRRKIAARSTELAAITRRLDTARSQESQAKKQADASATATAAIPSASAQPIGNSANSIERQANPIARSDRADAATPIPAAKAPLDASPDPAPEPDRKSPKLSGREGASAVIGPGAASNPSDFELRSGRVSRTP
jgi:hypothetical protein